MGIKVHEFTFLSSGVKVLFRQVSPLIAIDVRNAMEKEKPKPPMDVIEMPSGDLEEQPNEDHPDYIDALDEFEALVNRKVNEAFAKRAHMKFDYEGWEDEVKDYREAVGGELKDTDAWIFLTRIIASGNEMNDFYAALTAASNPTPEAIQAAKDSFRNELGR